MACLVGSALYTPCVHTVDQAVVHCSGSAINRILCRVVQRIHCLVRPIIKEDSAGINVVLFRGRAVNHHRTKDTHPRLDGVMAVVPTGSIVGSNEFISERVSRCDRTLCDRRHAIVLGAVQLSDTMEMD